MSLKKYIPTLTTAVQIILVVSAMTALGVLAKTTGFFQKLTGRM